MKFCDPSDISTRNEVILLKQAWENDTAKFSKLSDEEMDEWMNKRAKTAFNEIMASGSNLGNDDDRPVLPEPIEGKDQARTPIQPHNPHPSAPSSSNNQPMHSPNTSDENPPPIQPTNI